MLVTLKEIGKMSHHVITYLKPLSEIKKILGLSVSKIENNKILSPDERNYLLSKHESTITKVKTLEIGKITEIPQMEDWFNYLKSLQKELKPIKDLCLEVIDQRAKLLFVPEKGQRRSRKKPPIEVAINQRRGSIDYVNIFNPCRIVGLPINFKCSIIPTNEVEFNKILEQLTQFLVKCGKPIDSVEGALVYTWYSSELSRDR
jgi:hypothetical protein